jgi:hypothetical protein
MRLERCCRTISIDTDRTRSKEPILKTRCLFVPAALAGSLALVAVALPARADDAPQLDCTMQFKLSGWSAIYERADGSGTVTCADGTSMPVTIRARGAGLSVGKTKIDNGTGKFAYVHSIDQVLGSYAQADAHAGVSKTATAQLLTNGKVSVALAGTGEGFDIGIGFAEFTLVRGE